MNRRIDEPMEEQMEIVLTSRQVFVLATLIVGVALVMFVVGFSMGKRAERRKMVVGTPQAAADLLSRLDEMEKESREYVAKKALTEVRKREITLDETQENGNDTPTEDPAAPARPTMQAPAPAAAKTPVAPDRASMAPAAAKKTQGIIALNRTVSRVEAAPAAKAAPKAAAKAAPKTGETSGRQLTGSFGRARRLETAPRKSDPSRISAHN